jgi:peptidyl-prolyl cis-trans isomerase B (cyclophilin B)
VLAAARESDDVNPAKASSSCQFYIVQGKIFTDGGLDSVEVREDLKERYLNISAKYIKPSGKRPIWTRIIPYSEKW